MRALAVSIWVFVNLVIIGMGGYIYLLWSQYWMYLERQNPNVITTRNVYDQQIYNYNHGILNESKYDNEILSNTKKKLQTRDLKNISVILVKNSKPRFPNLQNKELELDTDKFRCLDDSDSECEEKIANFKIELLYELRRVFTDESNVFKSGVETQNPYNVYYKGKRENFMDKNTKQLLCELKKVQVRSVLKTDEPFNKLEIGKHLPRRTLLDNKHYNTCAIIASAGSLKDSNLGALIDSHDLVLRFNHAPTKDYEKDVGKKTSIRILNSQVVTKPEYNFLHSELYRNINILAWDPCSYNCTLREWYNNPDFNLFPVYVQFKKKHPKSKFFLLDPRSLWNLWDYLQGNSPNRLRRNPPSSGFLGIAQLLPHCDYVDVFEYIPSTRATRTCHYYDEEDNPSCTFGAWHPLAAEKLIAYSINNASDKEVFQTGFIRIPGFSKLKC